MSFITSRKHPTSPPSVLSPAGCLSAALAGALLLPAATAQAQSGGAKLPSVQVDAVKESPYKAEQSASPKYSQPLLDTPQTLQILKRPLMEQQAATTLTEVLRNTPGVGTFFLGENGSTSTGDTVYMRGFDISSAIFVDNVRDLGAISRDVFNLQQVEVLKGAAGTDNGRGAPTGSVNLVTKQPELADAVTASGTYGSWNQKRATVDWNKVLNPEQGLALRLNLMKQHSGVPGRHQVHSSRDGFAPSLAWGLNTPTRIFFNYVHMQQDNVPDGGVVTIGLPGYSSPDPNRPFISRAPKVNPSNYYGHVDDYDRVNADMYTLRVQHDVSPGLKLENSTRYARTDQDYRLASFIATGSDRGRFKAGLRTPSATDLATWELARNIVTRRDQANEILSNQTHATAQFNTGALRHTLVGGLELTRERQHALAFTVDGFRPPANLYQPDPRFNESEVNIRTTGRNKGQIDTLSLYVLDTLKFDERWSLNLGLRADHYRTSFNGIASGTATALNTSGNLPSWKLAAVFKPTGYSSVYALLASSQQPPGGNNLSLSASRRNPSNPDYAPQKTRTAELGTKWDLLDRRLAVTAALFRTDVHNEIEPGTLADTWFQVGEKRTAGVELGVTGELTRDISLTAGYSRMNSRVNKGRVVTANGENYLAYAPRQSLTSWATWRAAPGLALGGGLRYTDGLLRGTDSNALGTPTRTDAYWLVDAMASYAINKTVELQFNVTNLFNKQYAAAINKSGYRYTPGGTRAVSLTGNFRF
ncbi:catecholate siderophore receptor Fiu [Herbaspirillum aquaticum]|uniref:catecholate siderophore receptor Fiu n=1 Tax=Herbaspirillum aquaticum TaxID=568783 RepID=UPI0024DE2779|nr:catecholate siderophore receptor Fiu [Herbaspirillum aquaticum]